MNPEQWNTLLSIWSVVHGFAHLAQAGQFDAFHPEGGREGMMRATLAPMLEKQLIALQAGAMTGKRVLNTDRGGTRGGRKTGPEKKSA